MSKIVCTMPMRNEAWCLGLTARAVLMWADDLIIYNHCCTDTSGEIIKELHEECTDTSGEIIKELHEEFLPRVHWIEDPNPEWQEMRHRQSLLEAARYLDGTTHIILVDADEVLTGPLIPLIRDDILSMPSKCIFQLPWIQLRGGITEYHSYGVWAEQNVSFAFVDRPEYHWAQRDGYDFHHRHPMGPQMLPFRPIPRKRGGLMHLQMASERRLRAKQALYKMTEVLRWPGRSTVEQINAMYNVAVYGQETPRRDPFIMAQVPKEWWAPYDRLMGHLKIHAEPWQEARCRELWAEHGPDKFKGLDLYGVVG